MTIQQTQIFLTVETTIPSDIETVWDSWYGPDDIKMWCHASDDWGVGEVENDLRVGGTFMTEMKALDGSTGFAFRGVYTEVTEHKKIAYTIEGGRRVIVTFEETPEGVRVREEFEPEDENSHDLQKSGWQAILDNFGKYVESK